MRRCLSGLIGFGAFVLLAGCHGIGTPPGHDVPNRIIRAEVVAFDQPLIYNRFGSINPYGMIYALAGDVEDMSSRNYGEATPFSEATPAGKVRLKAEKRPRPLVMRMNEGDVLEVTFYNRLLPDQPDLSDDELSGEGLRWQPPIIDTEPETSVSYTNLGEEELEGAEPEHAEELDAGITAERDRRGNNWPATRKASITIQGLTPIDDNFDPIGTGIQPILPGQQTVYRYRADRTGTHLFYSNGAPAGGEGEGGSLTHGLFGAVMVEPLGSRWYRSQVKAEDLDAAMDAAAAPALIDYEAVDDDGKPVLNMLRPVSGAYETYDLVHGDINAIIVDCAAPYKELERCRGKHSDAFREFTVIFHDELKTFYADEFTALEQFGQLTGIGDGFAINYGASGMGTVLLANRLGIGPAKDCLECLYEEFFLQSWANGDPALLAQYEDDPANVHHAYLNDRVSFRNLHAGPKETHVFHLHAHQWLSANNEREGTYLDSQTIAPLQGFAYDIYDGGLDDWGSTPFNLTNGAGNRNRTVGDSIFHCHLYPHFAQGMWALWRNHDVFEDGSRRLPDGLSTDNYGRSGTDPISGEVVTVDGKESGTPIPAIVPLPGQALPPMPTYGEDGMPGYPFFMEAKAGHRAPQPPKDFHQEDDETYRDAGLPRHIFTGVGERELSGLSPDQVQNAIDDGTLVKKAVDSGDFSGHILSAEVKILDNEGEPNEQRAMDFHAGAASEFKTVKGDVRPHSGGPAYPSVTPEGADAPFTVNGAPGARGAPFADPCYDPALTDMRIYDVSAIQLDLVVNKAGWHDPQARINVLSKDVEDWENRTTGEAEPFFFRAESGECIEYRHTNRTPKDLELDDFQVKTPTDIIGQHIHLVKFDVTASDGSGNGFNYEDGTLAPDAVEERIEAINTFLGYEKLTPREGEDAYQTTVQRWFADPLLTAPSRDPDAKDRTLRTVFTHDHFAPSSIQQHGFYSALLIEPAETDWLDPETGVSIVDDQGQAVGSKALIVGTDENGLHVDHREFALAVADFALLYEPRHEDALPDAEDAQGIDALVVQADPYSEVGKTLRERRDEIRTHEGVPVAPPAKPEAISKDHHDPYLVNYKHEPIPLRVGENVPDRRHDRDCELYNLVEHEIETDEGTEIRAKLEVKESDQSIRFQADGDQGDMAHVFNSLTHGDPCTPIVEGYEGEQVQVRLIQGAQEVQHMFQIQGLAWPRIVDEGVTLSTSESQRLEARQAIDENVYNLTAAQEIGISEHFEAKLPALSNVGGGRDVNDAFYSFSTADALWNGAWGLIRTYSSTCALDPTSETPNPGGDPQGRDNCEDDRDTIGERLVRLDNPTPETDKQGELTIANLDAFSTPSFCPVDADTENFEIAAVTVQDLIGKPLVYNHTNSISDRDALVFVELPDSIAPSLSLKKSDVLTPLRAAYEAREIQPLVLRARAGQCVGITLYNLLPSELADRKGDALMPRITPLNVDQDCGHEGQPACSAEDPDDLRPSTDVGLMVQMLPQNIAVHGGSWIGWNRQGTVAATASDDGGITPLRLVYYAGRVDIEDQGDGTHRAEATPYAYGPINMIATGDILSHGLHGMIGTLIIEPEDAEWTLVDGRNDAAIVTYPDPEAYGGERTFREFVIAYQDGLNLDYYDKLSGETRTILDCPVCDDSYDLGEKALSYRTAPFWARLRVRYNDRNEPVIHDIRPQSNLNQVVFPTNFFDESYRAIPTPSFSAIEGEDVRFRISVPYGRARQRAFTVYGHGYDDIKPEFGSANSTLLSVGKAITARLRSTDHQDEHYPGVKAGRWLYRDGPAQMWSGGVWGRFTVDTDGDVETATK